MILRIMSRVKKREGVNSSSRLRHPQLLLANNVSLHHRFIINIITITTVITFIINQGCTNCCSLAAGLLGNEERMRK